MWEPDFVSEELEKEMEEKNLPEGDRDEIRRFAEFLQWRKAKKADKKTPPISQEMKDWLLGKE